MIVRFKRSDTPTPRCIARRSIPTSALLLFLLLLLALAPACGLSVEQSVPLENVDQGLTTDDKNAATAPAASEPEERDVVERDSSGEGGSDSGGSGGGSGGGSDSGDGAAGSMPPPSATPAPRAEEPAAAPDTRPGMGDDTTEFADEESADDGTASGGEARPRPQGRPAPLKAGERDDNELFDEYLDYLDTYRGAPALEADVSERYIITTIDANQRPLLNAHIEVYADDQQDQQDQPVFEGRTYAGGKTIFLPRTVDVSDNTNQFRIVASYDGDTTETTIQRGEQHSIELVVGEISPDAPIYLDMLFLLDTTGSMADELSHIQDTIDSIAQRIDTMTPRPIVRFGVVAYRDHGDQYVTRSYDFTDDVAAFRGQLASFSADGGGDTPEALNEALHEAVQSVSWKDDNAIRLIFLVADAGPHLDDSQDYDYMTEIRHAVARGIKLYPIAASNTDPFAEYVFRQLAQQTLGRFVFLTYQEGESSGVPGEDTPLEAGEQPYTVERLDDLIVQIVQRELGMARGIE